MGNSKDQILYFMVYSGFLNATVLKTPIFLAIKYLAPLFAENAFLEGLSECAKSENTDIAIKKIKKNLTFDFCYVNKRLICV